ncbi:Protein CLT2 chloroplastic [Zea mays]|uniref:Protein CLT2 chloroplastic n=1 Tax=Zea mays TaxID=4577 RepID=A0A1D6KBS5_MAIZE|nr:Protein CLT2 chloroplastic [Zea mays]
MKFWIGLSATVKWTGLPPAHPGLVLVEPKARVLVAGGGIGGLAFALAARRKGFEVLVLERDLSTVRGEGRYRSPIQLQSNALAALEARVRLPARCPRASGFCTAVGQGDTTDLPLRQVAYDAHASLGNPWPLQADHARFFVLLQEFVFIDGAKRLEGKRPDIFVVNYFGSGFQVRQ